MQRIIKLPNGDKKLDQRSDGYVTFKIFLWAVSLLLSIIIFFWGVYAFGHSNLNDRVNKIDISQTDIKCQLSQIQSDISWIKLTLSKKDN